MERDAMPSEMLAGPCNQIVDYDAEREVSIRCGRPWDDPHQAIPPAYTEHIGRQFSLVEALP